MDWRDTLFVHWPVAPEPLRAMLPPGVQLDVFEGSAWIGIVAFAIARARARGVPTSLALRTFGEINVRTYVTGGGIPGVWFLSLDAASTFTVAAGRRALHLPYYNARIANAWTGETCAYDLDRIDPRGVPARFAAQARFARDARAAAPRTLEHRLVERYSFFTADRRGRIVRGDVSHQPWLLRDATAEIAENTLLVAAGVDVSPGNPLVHASTGVAARAQRPVRA